MDTLLDILRGNMTPEARVWTALAPTVIGATYFLGGLLAYLIRWKIWGHYQDREMLKRSETKLLGMWVRLCFAWLMRPLWFLFLASGLPANAVSTLSVLLAGASGICLAAGRFALGGWLYILSGILDVVDGRVARAHGEQGPQGAALDSILDRYADAAIFAGLGWYYRDSWVLAVVLIGMAGAFIVPYIRAKGEIEGIPMAGVGIMQRAERIVYLGVSVALAPAFEVWFFDPYAAHPMHWAAIAGILLLAVSSHISGAQRFAYVLRSLSDGRSGQGVLSVGKRSIARSFTSSLLATGIDFACVAALVEAFAYDPVLATLLGSGVGGASNFAINRVWAFGSREESKRSQAARYVFVSITSALLNSGGVAVILLLPGVDYRIAWLVARAAVFLTWNYPLHRDYVFREPVQHAKASGTV